MKSLHLSSAPQRGPGAVAQFRASVKAYSMWTQTLLARDELDGWPGLRPHVDIVLAGSVAPVSPSAPVRISTFPCRSDNTRDTLAKAINCWSQGDMK